MLQNTKSTSRYTVFIACVVTFTMLMPKAAETNKNGSVQYIYTGLKAHVILYIFQMECYNVWTGIINCYVLVLFDQHIFFYMKNLFQKNNIYMNIYTHTYTQENYILNYTLIHSLYNIQCNITVIVFKLKRFNLFV